MPSPVVASSASSSSELWRIQPPSSQPPPSSSWTDQIMTQALARQISSYNDPSPPSSSSPKSLARALGHCLAGRPAWQTSDPQSYAAVIRALRQPAGGALLQQKQQQEVERPNAASPMSTSDLKETSGSPLNSPPCANSNSSSGTLGDTKPHDGPALLPRKENEGAQVSHLGNALRAAAMAAAATSIKPDDEEYGQAGNLCWAAKATPSALSAHAALGSGATKVNKRRSRATNKVPITVLSADTNNFRAMVQKLTGIPLSPPIQRNRLQFWNNPEVSVLKPHPTRPSQSIQGLPTLDTSAYFLVDGGSTSVHPHSSKLLSGENVLQDFPSHPFLKPLRQQSNFCFNANLAAELGSTRTGAHVNHSNFSHGANSDLKPMHPNLVGNSSSLGASLPSLWDPTERGQKFFSDKSAGNDVYNGLVGGADQFNHRQASSFEGLLMGNDRSDLDMSSRMFSVDSWLSSDTVLPNKIELSRTA